MFNRDRMLSTSSLEDGLNELLNEMAKSIPVPKGAEREQLVESLKETLMETFGNRVPENLFKDEDMIKKLKVVTHAALTEHYTGILAKAMTPTGDLDLTDKKTRDACENLFKLLNPLTKNPDEKQLNGFINDLKTIMKNEATKSPAPRPSRDAKKDEHDPFEEDFYNAQMFGSTKSGFPMMLLRAISNTVGATDIAVLQSTSAVAGLMFRTDNIGANLSSDARAALDVRLSAISGSLESILDSINPAISEKLSDVAGNNRPPPTLDHK